MNTTYETSELTSSKTNMAPTTTFAKSKKGVVVLVALCMMFFYTGHLSRGGEQSSNVSLLRNGLRESGGVTTTNDCVSNSDEKACTASTLEGGCYWYPYLGSGQCSSTSRARTNNQIRHDTAAVIYFNTINAAMAAAAAAAADPSSLSLAAAAAAAALKMIVMQRCYGDPSPDVNCVISCVGYERWERELRKEEIRYHHW